MSIAPVNTNLNSAFSPFSENNAIKLLEKQKQQLQEQIQNVNESKIDDKAKQEKIKSLQDLVQQIDMEIQQRRSEKLGQGLDTHQSAAGVQANSGVAGDNGDASGMTQLIRANAVYSQVKILERTKNSLEGKISGLKTEIKLDEERGCDTKAKRKELHDSEYRAKMLARKAGGTLKSIKEDIREASKKEADDIHAISRDGKENKQDAIPTGNTNMKNTLREGSGKMDLNYSEIDIRA